MTPTEYELKWRKLAQKRNKLQRELGGWALDEKTDKRKRAILQKTLDELKQLEKHRPETKVTYAFGTAHKMKRI